MPAPVPRRGYGIHAHNRVLSLQALAETIPQFCRGRQEETGVSVALFAPINDGWRKRLRDAVERIGAQRVVAARLGIAETTMTTMLLSPTAKVSFERVAVIAREARVSLDWIAYGTSTPAVDECELAQALAEAEALAAPGRLSPLDLARAAHLIYMRALEQPGSPYGRSELLRILNISA